MALTWDVSKIENHEEVTTLRGDGVIDQWHPVTVALIWSTIPVKLGDITEKNAAEFYARLRMVERLNGPSLIRAEVDGVRPKGEAAFITPDEVKAHVGLSTNVANESRAAFLKGIVTRRLDDDVRWFGAVEKAADAV